MKKIIPFIIIVITILQLFAPFSVGLNNKKIEINKNIVSAATFAETYGTVPDDLRNKAKADCLEGTSLKEFCAKARTVSDASTVGLYIYVIGKDYTGDDRYRFSIKATDESSGSVVSNEEGIISTSSDAIDEDKGLTNKNDPATGDNKTKYDGALFVKTPIKGIAVNTKYTINITVTKIVDTLAGVIPNLTSDLEPLTGVEFSTEEGKTKTSNVGSNNVSINDAGTLPACAMWIGTGTPMGCVAQGLYYLLFKPTSFIFGLTGQALDFTLMYSIDDNSYRSNFVTEGWGTVRDFCNMFFIFVLLYVAFGTILNLHGVKTKEMIINVVIIGLLMNFSLFATQVIIDASNILARVFYNQNTIITGAATKDANGNITSVTSELGEFGEIKLSEAIVSKVNPQKLIIEAQKIDQIQIKGSAGNEDKTTTAGGITTGSFILVTLLATAVNVVGLIAFLSCAIIFISRVIGLWLAMILVPLAFFSYTVPALSGMKMVGWQHWWPDTLKLAFLAPVFTFFMYIIVGFMSKGLGVIDADSKTGLSFVVAIVVPFIFIMILLMKAKEIAKDMSGEIGQSITGAISKVGGLALGAAGGAVLGLGAGALRGTVGNLGNKLATSQWASTHGAVGRGFQNVGKWAGGSSFDVRATKIGAAAQKGIGSDVNLGKAKEGGYAKHLEEKVVKRQKRAKELEVHESEPLKQKLNTVERDLQELLRKNSHELETLDKQIKAAREDASDINSKETTDPAKVAAKKAALAAASAMGTGTTTDVARKAAALAAANAMDVDDTIKVQTKKDANDKVEELKAKKKAIRTGTAFNETRLTEALPGTARGLVNDYVGNTMNGRTINQLEFEDISHAHAAIEKENRDRKWGYAKAKSRWGGRAEKEAAHKIRMDAKLTDSGEKSHH